MPNHCFASPACVAGFAVLTLSLAMPAAAVDLTVQSVQVNQGVQYGTTHLIAGKATFVRATIGVSGAAAGVGDVDAILRVFINGSEASFSPVFSINGPITAPLSPQLTNLNDTLNFLILPPQSNDVDFVVEVNPNHRVVETDPNNNALTTANTVFECRATVEVVYVPIDYQPLGMTPDATLIEPGFGDGFLRAIYSPGEFNYHRSPLPPLLWTLPIGTSSNALLTTLRDVRLNQLPAAGYSSPPFVFGWLPGNPFSGNGKSIGIPGDVAFGNTDIARFQRTFAHEFGHLIGRFHNNLTINTVGIDTEHHLWDTEELPQVFPPTKRDVMVAGLLTQDAFVNDGTYNMFLSDSRVQCTEGATAGLAYHGPVLRVSGVITSATRAVVFDPVMQIDRGPLTPDDQRGDLLIVAFDARGNELLSLGYRTDTSAELCVEHAFGPALLDPQSPFHALIPRTISGQLVDRIELRDRASGQLLAERHRSAHAPQANLTLVSGSAGGRVILGDKAAQAVRAGKKGDDQGEGKIGDALVRGHVRVEWSGSDADGDSLTYNLLYSPDGGQSWLPLMVNGNANVFEFSDSDVPAGAAGSALLRLVASDGLNIGEDVSIAFALGSGSPPDVYLLTPNDGQSILQHAPVAFHAAAWDMEDLMLDGEQIEWTSSIDGSFGSSRLFIGSDLSPGEHTITVTAVDFDGMSASKSIDITIVPRDVDGPGSPADLNGDGVVNSLDLGILLSSWSIPATAPGCGGGASCPADLDGDGHVNSLDLGMLLAAWTL